MTTTKTQRQNGGEKPLFTRHVSNGLLDLKSIRQEIEKAQEIGERENAGHRERLAWRKYRDLMEAALDVRIDMIDADVDSHQREIEKAGGCMAMCRAGVQTDPSRGETRRLAGLRLRTGIAVNAPAAA